METQTETKSVHAAKLSVIVVTLCCCAVLAFVAVAALIVNMIMANAIDSDVAYYAWYSNNPDADTFTLQSDQEFLAFANITNGTATDGIGQFNFTGKTVELAANISLEAYDDRINNGEGWIPVGAFNGTFDGKGHKVVGLYVNRPLVDYQALFSRLGVNGVIKNLGVEGELVYGRNYVAGLVGYSQGTITDCYNAVGEVKAHAAPANAHSYAGGVVALADGGGGGIFNSHNRGSVYGGTATGNGSNGSYAGLGRPHGGDGGSSGSSYAGGIAGKANIVTNSYNLGIVNGGTAYGNGGHGGSANGYYAPGHGGQGGHASNAFVGGINGEGDVYNSFNMAKLVSGSGGGNGGNGGNGERGWYGGNGGNGGSVLTGGVSGRGHVANSYSVLLSQLEATLLIGGSGGYGGRGGGGAALPVYPNGISGSAMLGLLVGQPTTESNNCFYSAAQTDWNPAVGTGSLGSSLSFDDSLITENGTTLLNSLNAWIDLPENVSEPYSYWKMKDGYPVQDHTAESFTITYSSGGKLGVGGSVESDHKISDVPLKLSTQTFTRSHPWVQTGWSLSVDGSEKDFELGGTWTADQDAELYPYWEDTREAGEVLSAPTLDTKTETSFKINEITSTTGQPVKYAIGTPDSGGAPSDGWQSELEFIGLSAGIYYAYARAEANDTHKQGTPSPALEVKVGYYEIAWSLDGGFWTDPPPYDYIIKKDFILPKNVYKDGYTFQNWYIDSTRKTPAPNITKDDREDKHYYAKWTPNTLTVIYTVDGETTLTETRLYDKPFILYENITPPMKPSRTFLGWHSAGEGSTSGSWLPLTSVTADLLSNQIKTESTSVTLTAVWQSVHVPSIDMTDNQLSVQIDDPESWTYEWEQKINDEWIVCSNSPAIPIIPGETSQEFRCTVRFAGTVIATLYRTVSAPASAALIAVLIIIPVFLLTAAGLSIYFFVLRPKRLAAQGGQGKPTAKDDVQPVKTQEVKTAKANTSEQNIPNQTSQSKKKTPTTQSAKTEQQVSSAPKTNSKKKKSTVSGQAATS